MDNDCLIEPFKIEEFHAALFSMDPNKSPGSDGLKLTFYRKFWDLCGHDIFVSCCQWLESGTFPSSLNDTNIVLIPKCDNPVAMKDRRLISLCNVIYKIMSKVLANRPKQILPKCIYETQSAFVEGISILDNALVTFEIIHHMKCKTKRKNGDVALKIDIRKAYDKVDWGYLRAVMERMGFHDTWIRWIMLCVESVNYSVLVNQELVGPIIPGRAIRQGDPLSPYLFILCAEDLSNLIQHAERRGDLYGAKICRGAPTVTHLVFADDCFQG